MKNKPCKHFCLVFLCGLLLHLLLVGPLTMFEVTAQTTSAQSSKVKDAVAKFGTGDKARVKIELFNKAKIRGSISEARADSFIVTEQDSGKSVTVAYDEVKQIKGRNLSTGKKIAIGAGIAVGVLLMLVLIGLHLAD